MRPLPLFSIKQRNFSASCSSYSIFNIPNQFSKSYSTMTADSNANGSETHKEKVAVTPEIQESFDNKRDVSTEEMKELVTKKLTEKDIFVIDVRTPEEVAAGAVPTSKNIPVTELQEALSLPNTQFQLLYQFPKPSREMDKIIFYCRSGKRSQAAFEIAESLGFKKIRNYRGSWLAWNAAQGENDRSA
ncbi:Rhodanese-like domain-containing protein [Paraphysoderma sedebokerense]|nr:Rhodanese-like domain-containing protein [Paraphysoderma sedebokerense]